MIVHDFRCEKRHVSEHYVKRGVDSVLCPVCSEPASRVFLQAPKLDWLGMAQGESAGPEFVDRFHDVHNKENVRQQKILAEHGDYGPGYDPPPTLDD
jgi:hypothetical protein